jgi:DNA helicase-2/ATP-dependent DNA helicase PcrA
LLEPKEEADKLDDIAIFLDLLVDVFQSKGTKTAQSKADTWAGYARSLRDSGKCRNTAIIKSIDNILGELVVNKFEGNPRKDWMLIRHLLKASKNSELKEVDTAVEYLMAFNRGKAISSGLATSWQANDGYQSARVIVDAALTQEQLMSDDSDNSGLHVMTMHKSKGKQFDGVILFHEGNICSFTTYGDINPFQKSRKLLRVAVTRAKKYVLFLIDASSPPEILEEFNL